MVKLLLTFLLSSTLLPTSLAFQPISHRIHRRTTSFSATPTDSEIATLFSAIRDTTVLYDPSRGTCCRNKCSGCTYLDSEGNFAYEEYNADAEERGGWIAPYTKVDFGEKVHVSTWSKLLFEKGGELERNELQSALPLDVSVDAINALWVTLSPSVGYPKLKSTEVVRAIKGIEGSNYEMGGAVDYPSFHRAMLSAVNSGSAAETSVDYEALTKEELLELVAERGMNATFPKMKRIIIEELRFFDANGRQGKRHPVKNTLS